MTAISVLERFVVEINTTAALQHPYILPLFDSGESRMRSTTRIGSA